MLNYLQNSTTASDIHRPTAHEGSQPSSQSSPTEDARVNEPDNESMISTDSSQPSPSSPEHSTTSQHSSESVESEMDVDAFLGPEYHPCTPRLLTYRIVGDNIDKNIKPRNMTSDHQTRSLHYFHAYAVRDRIDLSSFSTDLPVPDLQQIDFDSLLPSRDDVDVLHANLAVLVGCILRKHMPFFDKYASGLGRHIMHEYTDHMSTKSEVVSILLDVVN